MGNSANSVIQKKRINESYNELTVIIPIMRSISVNYLINDINKCISSCSKVTSSYSILIVSEISSDMIKTVCDNISNVYYIIKSGDTLSGIAQRYSTTVAELVKLNNISNPNLIYGGTKLRIK